MEEEKDVDNDRWPPVNLLPAKVPVNEEVKVASDDEGVKNE